MSTAYEKAIETLRAQPRNWMVTGCAGFIGSHLVEKLLSLGQRVVGVDNFITGSQRNLDDCLDKVGRDAWQRFSLLNADITELVTCRAACAGADVVLHEAGFISVPESIEDPLFCHETNVTGTLNLLIAARDAGVKHFVYATSAAVYGDDATMPQREERIGKPMSPYGASKLMDEHYAWIFAKHYGVHTVGLRYFNVFGPRQNPHGGYAAVVPLWISTLVGGGECTVHGDGMQTRDFCHIDNVVQANILAGMATAPATAGGVYNVALGGSTTLLELHRLISEKLKAIDPAFRAREPRKSEPRQGDIRNSSADISKARAELGFEPAVSVDAGLAETVKWYAQRG